MSDSELESLKDDSISEDQRYELQREIDARIKNSQQISLCEFAKVAMKGLVLYVIQQKPGFSCDRTEEEMDQLWLRSDDENKKYLEENGGSISTIVGYMHMLMSWARIYQKVGKPKVVLSTNEGKRAIMEVYLIVLLLGSCYDESKYRIEEGNSVSFVYNGEGKCHLPIPGLSEDQMDSKNQAVLQLISPILDQTDRDSFPAYSQNLTAGGKHGNRPQYCFASPVYMVNGYTASSCKSMTLV